jgi:hypothetical protein
MGNNHDLSGKQEQQQQQQGKHTGVVSTFMAAPLPSSSPLLPSPSLSSSLPTATTAALPSVLKVLVGAGGMTPALVVS